MMPFRPSLASVVLVAGATLACQYLFGEYEVERGDDTPRRIVCVAGEYRCNGERLERCRGDRSGYRLVDLCATPDQCNLNTDSCRPCVPGEVHCRGSVLEVCTDQSTWQVGEDCQTRALCEQARRAGGTTCPAPVCAPGELRCEGATLLGCREGRDGWEVIDVCESAALCQQGILAGRTPAGCEPPACQPGEHRCEGARLLRCNADSTGWDERADCVDPGACSASTASCGPCPPGSYECSGAELRRCTDTGTFESARQCDAPALCDAANATCLPAQCDSPGEVRCRPDLGVYALEECTADRTWKLVRYCAAEVLCNAEARRCEPAACVPGTLRCRNQERERCSADGTEWISQEVCAPGSVCDPEAGCVEGCTPGETRCNNVYLEECRDGTWTRLERCATSGLCDAEGRQCLAPECGEALGTAKCEGGLLYQCRADRNGWETVTCQGSQICYAGPPASETSPNGLDSGRCTHCVPGTLSCDGTVLRRCDAAGESNLPVAECPGGCTVIDGTAHCAG